MSTMVLSRKQSVFSGSGRPGDSQAGGKDSIDTQDITVMDTKLKILEILQVRWRCLLDNRMVLSEHPQHLLVFTVHPQCAAGLPDFLHAFRFQEGVCRCLSYGGCRCNTSHGAGRYLMFPYMCMWNWRDWKGRHTNLLTCSTNIQQHCFYVLTWSMYSVFRLCFLSQSNVRVRVAMF